MSTYSLDEDIHKLLSQPQKAKGVRATKVVIAIMNLAKLNEDDSQSDHSKCIGDFNLATEHGNVVLSKLGFAFPCELQKRVLQPFDNARKTEMAAILPELCTQANVIFKDAIEIFEDGLIDVSSADHPFQASANELVVLELLPPLPASENEATKTVPFSTAPIYAKVHQ